MKKTKTTSFVKRDKSIISPRTDLHNEKIITQLAREMGRDRERQGEREREREGEREREREKEIKGERDFCKRSTSDEKNFE